jgi:hypothetical protein
VSDDIIADQSRHADVVRVVPLHVLFAAQRVHGRRAERVRERDYFVVCARATAAAQQRDAFGLVQKIGESVDICSGRQQRGRLQRARPCGHFIGRLAERDVAGQHDHGDALLLDRRVHRGGQYARELRRIGHQFDVVTAFLEQLLRMCFLKVAEADFR